MTFGGFVFNFEIGFFFYNLIQITQFLFSLIKVKTLITH